jgi:hypothetical protein
MWASVQTVRGCPKHCSFCSVWRTDGQKPRQRSTDIVVQEIVQLRRMGYCFIALADDNFYPVTLTDIELAKKQKNAPRVAELESLRAERFDLMERLSQLPKDLIFFTQITMEAAEDPQFLDAMRKARIRGALVGVESVTEEGLKSVYKDFNCSGDKLAERLRLFKKHGVHVLGSFIFGLSTDREDTFAATCRDGQARRGRLRAVRDDDSLPRYGRFSELGKKPGRPGAARRRRTGDALLADPGTSPPEALHATSDYGGGRNSPAHAEGWDRFYTFREIWIRSGCATSLKARLAFVFISKLYRQMYANTGIATDSARRKTSNRWARWLAKPCQRLFKGKPMPELSAPVPERSPLTVLT